MRSSFGVQKSTGTVAFGLIAPLKSEALHGRRGHRSSDRRACSPVKRCRQPLETTMRVNANAVIALGHIGLPEPILWKLLSDQIRR